jgi:photosystem II stability/assembly factor-like uncharacterized protein
MKIRVLLSLVTMTFIFAASSPLRAQWAQCNGPDGGPILTLAKMGNYIFAGARGGTVFRSSNNGANWLQVLGTTNTDIRGIAVNDSTVFVSSDSLYVSKDFGLTWTGRSLDSSGSGPIALLGRYLVVASRDDGVFRTSNEGHSWEKIGERRASCLLSIGNNLLVGSWTYPSLSLSSDSGSTWRVIDLVDSITRGLGSIALAGSDVVASGFWDGKVLRTTDTGKSWTKFDLTLPVNTGNYAAIAAVFQKGVVILAGAAVGLYRSLDGGTSWKFLDSMKVNSFLESNGDLIATTEDGVMLSTDLGTHWTRTSFGIHTFAVTSFASIGSHLFVGLEHKGVYRSDDSGATFFPTNIGMESSVVDQIVAIDTLLFAFSNKLFRSSDLGLSWDTTPVRAFAPATVSGNTLIAISGSGFIATSLDNGETWTKQSGRDEVVSLMAVGSDLYAAISGECGDVSHSSDYGLTWSSFSIREGCTGLYCLGSDDGHLYAGTGPAPASNGRGIFWRSSTDSEWTSNYSVFDWSFAVSDIAAKGAEVYFATTEGDWRFGRRGIGVFHSSNYGTSWASFNEGLTALIVPKLFLFSPYVFAGTQSSGVWRRAISKVDSPKADIAKSASNQSLTIYPNPTTESTTISITPEASGYAEIAIVNMLGQRVATVYSGVLDASEHAFTWGEPSPNPSRGREGGIINSGMYECLVRMNGRVQAKPIVVE